MTREKRSAKELAWIASFVAGATIAQQTASKAARDAFFLGVFDVSSLPNMLIGSALISILMVVISARLMRRYGPSRLMPGMFLASSGVLLTVWGLALVSRRSAAILLYLHVAGFGAVLISTFWSLVTERFDPRTAKQQMGRIAGAATLGGLLGGLLAERIGALVGASALLPILACLHLYCAWHVRALRVSTAPGQPAEDALPSLSVLRSNTHLVRLGALLLLISTLAAMLDYVFKARTVGTFTNEDDLLRFFAVFYTGLGLATFLLQSLLAKKSLEKLGLAGVVALLPGAAITGGGAILALPGLASAVFGRGAESMLRSSLFRSGYELFYTPIPEREKRSTKVLIDVGCDRFGDMAGGAVVLLVLTLPAAMTETGLAIGVIGLGVLALALTRALHRGYIESLEQSLREHAVTVPDGDFLDSTTMSVVRTMGGFGDEPVAEQVRDNLALVSRAAMELSFSFARPKRPQALDLSTSPPARDDPPNPFTSHDPAVVQHALDTTEVSGDEVGPILDLLAWDAVSAAAGRALARADSDCIDALVGRLCDPAAPFSVRRRLPRVLRDHGTPSAVAGLMKGLADPRFEVRYRCGRSLAALRRGDPKTEVSREVIDATMRRELEVGRRVWETRRLLDPLEPEAGDTISQLGASLDHMFRLLWLRYPDRPVDLAHTGLTSSDMQVRGTALEYLETTLPTDIRELLWPLLGEDELPDHPPIDPELATKRLIESTALIDRADIQAMLESQQDDGE